MASVTLPGRGINFGGWKNSGPKPKSGQIAKLGGVSPSASVPEQGTTHPLQPLVENKNFFCTECGKCCTGAGEVWINEAECDSLTGFLKISRTHFLAKYTKSYSKRPGWYLLQRKRGSGDCVFLEGKRCSVYGARPVQCATYPWWPDLMNDAVWEIEGQEVCEGINLPECEDSYVGTSVAAIHLQSASEHFASFEESKTSRKDRR